MHLNPRLAFLLTLPPLMWAGNVVIGRLMVGTSPPVLLNLIRWIGALLLLLPLGWRAFGTPAARAQVRARWPHLALLGLLGVGMYNALQYMALRTSSPLNVTLIAASSPLWMMLNGMLFFQARPGRRDLLAAVLSLAGVVTVLTRGHLLELAQIRLVPGDLLILVAIFCWSLYSWLLVVPPASMRDAARPAWNWAEFLLVQVAFGLVWAGAGAAVEAVALSAADERIRWGWPLGLALIYLATCPSLVAYYAWGVGVAQAGPSMAALFSNLTPLLTALISGAVFGTWPQGYHFAAFALIVAGIMISALHRPSTT
ncbi:MAG: DMT family transporter [Ideonella sp.]|nr:MAG: DMT family transporter [Burkholderiaceae bacterium]MBE7427433.1 DMT family transporter [Ideonella sp.]